MSDGIQIKEKVELLNKVKGLYVTQLSLFPQKYRNYGIIQITKLSLSELKGLLFEIYTKLDNKEVYEWVNQRSRNYMAKINKAITEEGYVIRENMLILIDRLQEEYEREER